ncbi:MAG: hypothetical protein K9G48_01530 [Reyranella sp.]|nr:hypothetical protein [Reyranella sp.]
MRRGEDVANLETISQTRGQRVFADVALDQANAAIRAEVGIAAAARTLKAAQRQIYKISTVG